jgi:1-pyrroline-5-carboxylate dehydrogenase
MATAEISTVILPRSPQGEFHNEPFVDFSKHENAHAMKDALVRIGDLLGHEYELVIGSEHLRTSGKIESRNPAKPDQIVGIHQKAGAEHAEKAMQAAKGFRGVEACSRRRARIAAAERGGDHPYAQV